MMHKRQTIEGFQKKPPLAISSFGRQQGKTTKLKDVVTNEVSKLSDYVSKLPGGQTMHFVFRYARLERCIYVMYPLRYCAGTVLFHFASTVPAAMLTSSGSLKCSRQAPGALGNEMQ